MDDAYLAQLLKFAVQFRGMYKHGSANAFMVGLLDHVKHLLCVSSRTDMMTVNQLQYEL